MVPKVGFYSQRGGFARKAKAVRGGSASCVALEGGDGDGCAVLRAGQCCGERCGLILEIQEGGDGSVLRFRRELRGNSGRN